MAVILRASRALKQIDRILNVLKLLASSKIEIPLAVTKRFIHSPIDILLLGIKLPLQSIYTLEVIHKDTYKEKDEK